MAEPEDLTLAILREIRSSITRLDEKLDNKIDSLDSKIDSLGRVVAADLHDMDAKFSNQITGLREAVMHYHSSVLGHGTIISELEARLRRVEQHLHLTPDN